VKGIRSGHYKEQENFLTEIGFIYDVMDLQYSVIESALIWYQSIYGNMLVPRSFIVPGDEGILI
jgi:transcription initiation factor TFIIIB Brf1 subunit/transcription initiation factor TFIIB